MIWGLVVILTILPARIKNEWNNIIHKNNILFCIFLILLIFISNEISAQYYYSDNRKIPLIVDSTKVLIKFDEFCTDENINFIIDNINRINSVKIDQFNLDGFVICSLSVYNNIYNFVDSLYNIEGIYLAEPFYLSSNGNPLPIGETFCVGLKFS